MKTVVVGAGIVGMLAAYRLAKEGVEVTLIDEDQPGAGASHGNAAKIALGECAPVPAPGVIMEGIKWMLKPDSPLSIHPSLSPGYLKFLTSMALKCNAKDFDHGLDITLQLAQNANELLDRYRDEGLEFEMHQNGVLLAFEDEDYFKEYRKGLGAFDRVGFTSEVLTGESLYAKEPELSTANKYGLFFSQDRQLQPDSITEGLIQQCQQLGVEILTNTKVAAIEAGQNRATAVLTSGGYRYEADTVIIAAGVWSRELAQGLGMNFPIYSGKGYSLDYRPAPISLQTSLTFEDARVAVTPLDGVVRLAGTMEFGAKDKNVNPVRVQAIREAAERGFKNWKIQEVAAYEQEPWAGYRPMTPDGLPIVGPTKKYSNVFMATGHAMLGLTLAPVTAEILVDQILHRPSEISERVRSAISPNRYL